MKKDDIELVSLAMKISDDITRLRDQMKDRGYGCFAFGINRAGIAFDDEMLRWISQFEPPPPAEDIHPAVLEAA